MQTLLWSDRVVRVVAAPCVQMLCICLWKGIFELCKKYSSHLASGLKPWYLKDRTFELSLGRGLVYYTVFLSLATWPQNGQDSSQVCKECGTFDVPMLVTHTTNGKHFLSSVLPFWLEACPEKTCWMTLFHWILFITQHCNLSWIRELNDLWYFMPIWLDYVT